LPAEPNIKILELNQHFVVLKKFVVKNLPSLGLHREEFQHQLGSVQPKYP
jgi:hypothetical protein